MYPTDVRVTSDTAEALANLATATAADRESFATLTATVASLTEQLKAKTETLLSKTLKLPS